MQDITFFGLQVLRALRNRGLIDAEKIEEYIARDGYAAGEGAALHDAQEIISEMKESGLRGRAGGFSHPA